MGGGREAGVVDDGGGLSDEAKFLNFKSTGKDHEIHIEKGEIAGSPKDIEEKKAGHVPV